MTLEMVELVVHRWLAASFTFLSGVRTGDLEVFCLLFQLMGPGLRTRRSLQAKCCLGENWTHSWEVFSRDLSQEKPMKACQGARGVPGQAWGARGPRLVTLVNEECGLESGGNLRSGSRPILIKDLTNVIYVNRVLNRDHTLITIKTCTQGAKKQI